MCPGLSAHGLHTFHEFNKSWWELDKQGVEVLIGEFDRYNKIAKQTVFRVLAFDVYQQYGWGF